MNGTALMEMEREARLVGCLVSIHVIIKKGEEEEGDSRGPSQIPSLKVPPKRQKQFV
jgi:hypothetical protein